MDDITKRAEAAVSIAWRAMPEIKRSAHIEKIVLDDLGAKNGTYEEDTGIIRLNYRLFQETGPGMIQGIDERGCDPPIHSPYISRAMHTLIHEMSHAIGRTFDLDEGYIWKNISGWEQNPHDDLGTDRYIERRPGWEYGPSEWRHESGAWFWRNYSRKSPHEDFADCLTLLVIGWIHLFTGEIGQKKLEYVRTIQAMTPYRSKIRKAQGLIIEACSEWRKRLK